MEDGYNTGVGDLGNKLSGGERQRVLIARGLLKKNAKIYLLKSIDYFTKTNSPKRIALISLELAILYSRLGQHEAAESYLLKTISAFHRKERIHT